MVHDILIARIRNKERSFFQATMLKKSKKKMRRRNTEPSIFFPDNEPLRLQSPTEESEPL